MSELSLSRRAAMMGLAGGAAALALRPELARAKAEMQGALRPQVYRFGLGGFEITTILDGAVQIDGPHPIFGEDQLEEDVHDLMEENFLPKNRVEIGFTPTLINTGSELVLFDSGNGKPQQPARGHLADRLAEAGVTPDQIDVVVITHFHPDHIGGLSTDGEKTFPNARYVAGETEHNWWRANSTVRGEEYEMLLKNTAFAVEDQMTFVKDGEDVVGGISAVAAFGHTPGHTVFHIESDGRRLMVTGDTANHFVASLLRPEWHVRFDMEKENAIAARKKVFGMLAADMIPFIGYHMPFPSVGYVETEGDGFRYHAASYQLHL